MQSLFLQGQVSSEKDLSSELCTGGKQNYKEQVQIRGGDKDCLLEKANWLAVSSPSQQGLLLGKCRLFSIYICKLFHAIRQLIKRRAREKDIHRRLRSNTYKDGN